MKLNYDNIVIDFISSKSNLDGLIINSKNDLDYLKIRIDLAKKTWKDFSNIDSFMNDVLEENDFCFVNMDNQNEISEDLGSQLFLFIRKNVKVIFYNEKTETLQNSNLFKYLNWMRLIKIEQINYFNLAPNSKVLLQANGDAVYGFKNSIYRSSDNLKESNVFGYFYFPLNDNTIENAFLSAINTEKNINTDYNEVRNIKFIKAFYVSEKGFAKGEIS